VRVRLAVALLVVAFAGCGDDSDRPTDPKQSEDPAALRAEAEGVAQEYADALRAGDVETVCRVTLPERRFGESVEECATAYAAPPRENLGKLTHVTLFEDSARAFFSRGGHLNLRRAGDGWYVDPAD
jgi:hypothetical protein